MKKTIVFLIAALIAYSSAGQTKVLHMEIKSEIDPRTSRYVTLALAHAEKIEASVVLIEMDTYGGLLTDAKEIVDKIMHFEKPVWVFINADAASAGALISIACDSIYMSPGATIGAATVVDATGQKAPDKYQSYMRSIMRSTAEENGRDPKIAEAMVDENIEIDSITSAGQIVTFTTSEALKHGFCDAKVNSIQDILERNQIKDYSVEKFELGASEKIISLALNPFISGILILIIISGIYFEMQTPGLGFAGLAALIALIFYLVPYYLNGLAENWEVIAFFVGVILIVLEIFIIPGFGVPGIAGIIMMLGSLVLIMINNNNFDFEFVPMDNLLAAFAAAIGGMLGGVLLLFALGANLSKTKLYARVALTDTQDSALGYVSNFNVTSLKGKTGVAHTVLRPAGKVTIDGQLFDAYTRGEYIEKDQAIEVISDEGAALKVKIRA